MQVVSCVLAFLTSSVLALPPYIEPCARTDPNFNDCALKHGRKHLHELVKGDRKHQVNSLDPLLISEVHIVERGIDIKLTDLTVTGLNDTELLRTDFDFDSEEAVVHFVVPRAVVIGKYEIKGKILVVPITGSGIINVTLVHADSNIKIQLEKETIDGKQYLTMKESKSISVTPKRMYCNFSNLFRGNKVLGKQMNEFIDENWEDVYKEISPPVTEAFVKSIQITINKIFHTASYEELFPLNLS